MSHSLVLQIQFFNWFRFFWFDQSKLIVSSELRIQFLEGQPEFPVNMITIYTKSVSLWEPLHVVVECQQEIEINWNSSAFTSPK